MRISDWSSDVCSSDLVGIVPMTDDYAAAVGLPKDRGEIVQRVEDGAPAAKAGLKRGDIVTKVGGKDVTPQQSLSYLIANVKPGARVTGTVDVARLRHRPGAEIGREHVGTPLNNAHIVCRLLLE